MIPEFYIEQGGNGGYQGSVLNGLDVKDNDKHNTAVVYLPYVVRPFGEKAPNYFDDSDSKSGKPVADIKVGDTVSVKVPQGKFDMLEFWKGKNIAELKEYQFKVGAIVDYPYANEGQYTGDSGIDVIMSQEYLKKTTGIENSTVVYVDMLNGADHKRINRQIGKISSKTPGVLVVDTVQDKLDDQAQTQRQKMYEYGIVAIILLISMLNILNSVSYNLTSRTSEFGMLRAVGIDEEDFKKMTIYEGFLYGLVSNIVVTAIGLAMQTYLYHHLNYDLYQIEFSVNYAIYAVIIIGNIAIGILATWLTSRKIGKVDIVEAINIIE
ncbi:MAG: FtsX-like permease family protein [Clostridioides sp.]|nr:FtsX-like permease family protein [Clostridioides sp.]